MRADIHDLLVRPENGSLLADIGHHVLYRPISAVSREFTGRSLPAAADPREWGAALARLGEKVDFALAPRHRAFVRREDLTVRAEDWERIAKKLENVRKTDPGREKVLRDHLRDLIENHYNPSEDIRSLVAKARKNRDFATTFHGVRVPSLTGEAGKTVRNIATDAAAAYGGTEIARHLEEKRSHESMSASAHLQAAADLLERIPAMANGAKYARDLVDAGVIADAELDKHARIFEDTYLRSPEDAQTLFSAFLRGQENLKTAGLGEAVGAETPGKPQTNGFEQMCLDAYRGHSGL